MPYWMRFRGLWLGPVSTLVLASLTHPLAETYSKTSLYMK